jgi:transcriptional regulator with XRE-family HTH domain
LTGLGDRLKEARTAKGYSLDDLQSITKIQKRYLSGIENEDYSMMPGAFYVRAFIKQYSEAVGLDADEMLSLYKESSMHEKLEEETSQVTPPMKRTRGIQGSSRLNEMIPKIIVALFIIVIIVVVWVLWQQGASKNAGLDVEPEEPITMDNNGPQTGNLDNGAAEDESDEETTTEPDPEPEEEVIAQSITYVGTSGEDSTYTLKDAEEFMLRIDTSGDSWIGVQDENREERTSLARVMTAGETIELDVSDVEFVRIRVGRTQNTSIYINDELLDYSSDAITQNIIIEYEK